MQATVDYKQLYEQQLLLIESLKHTVKDLQHQLGQLRTMVFGSRQERFVASDNSKVTGQLALLLDADTIAACKITNSTKVSYIRNKTTVLRNTPHPGRSKLPEHLRRQVIVIEPDTDVSGLKKIGDEITEVLDYIPAELYVKQYVRSKYVLPVSGNGSTIITASLPGRMMEKCMAGEGLLAHIVVDKYEYHMPLHRQLQRLERQGIEIAQSSMNDWTQRTLEQLYSLYEVHKNQVLQSRYLHADETTLKVLDESKKGTTHQGYYWVYHNSVEKIVLFDYRPGRGREGPDDILQGYQGYLQTDGYGVYESFGTRPGITLLHCMAHARRKFFDALGNDKAQAEQALQLFGQLYDTERLIKEQGLKGDAIIELRQKEAVPVLAALQQWMNEQVNSGLLKKGPLASAIGYSLSRWDKLCLYTTDAILQIDNNPVENAIRPVAIGRKNYLFAGSHQAAQRAAMIYSLLATCRAHQINSYEWLKDVLERMHLYTTHNIAELLPQNWKKHQPNYMG